jgi:hypothetical protein
MATSATVNSSYAGEVAGEIIGQAYKEMDTIQKNAVSVLANIAYQTTIRKIEYANGRQDYACGFTPTGSVTLSEKQLTPKKIKNENELCKEDWRQVWDSASMGFSAHNDRMPADESQAFLAEMLADISEAVDQDIWQGDASNSGEFDGFVKKFQADANIVKPTYASLSKANILAQMELIMNSIPDALLKKDLVWACGYDVEKYYKQAVADGDYLNQGVVGDKPLDFLGYELTPIGGMPSSTIVVYERKNLYFGTGLMQDFNRVDVKDMDESDLSGNIRYKMVYSAGVEYVNSGEIVYYGVAS